MRVNVFYFIICVFLLSSCAVSSFSSRSTNRNLYQKGHFKKPAGFKMSNSKSEHKEKFQADNSSLNFSKELTLIRDSIISKTNHEELVIPVIKKQNSYNNAPRLDNNFKSVLIPKRDSLANTKLVRKTHTIAIIGAVFAHLALALCAIGLSSLIVAVSFTVFGLFFVAIGFALSIAAIVLNLITLRYLRRIDDGKKAYYAITIVSLELAIIGAIAVLTILIVLAIIALLSL